MTILDISIIIFIILESANVTILYFFPNSKKGNGVAVFAQWEKSKQNENEHLFTQYMTYWVAGTKLIFICLLFIILLFGNETTKISAVLIMILSIATYFWKLKPIMENLDAKGEIIPQGYSKILNYMIIGMMSMFSVALISHIFLK